MKDKSLTAYSHDLGNNENRAELDFKLHLLHQRRSTSSQSKYPNFLGDGHWWFELSPASPLSITSVYGVSIRALFVHIFLGCIEAMDAHQK